MTPQEKEPSMGRILQFACDCVSHLHAAARDPWSYVSRAGLISSETKEIILNKTYRVEKYYQPNFPVLPTHSEGSRWVYWAEEIEIEKPAGWQLPES